MFSRVLFVCVGNICRSPMAEFWAREQLKQAGQTVQLTSAGLGALVDSPMAEHALAILTEQGIDGSGHRAQQVNAEFVTSADIILTMEDWQTDEILLAFPQSRGKVFRLGHWAGTDIEDPYRQPLSAFEDVFDQVKNYWKTWQVKLWSL